MRALLNLLKGLIKVLQIETSTNGGGKKKCEGAKQIVNGARRVIEILKIKFEGFTDDTVDQ